MKTKICGNCKKEKGFNEFNKNSVKKDGLQTMCKACRKIYHREHYLKNKKRYIKQSNERKKRLREDFLEHKKTLKCEKCGEDRWYCLDFHHKDPKEKNEDISRLIGEGRSKEKILEEIKKCNVLCSNCHREKHYLMRM